VSCQWRSLEENEALDDLLLAHPLVLRKGSPRRGGINTNASARSRCRKGGLASARRIFRAAGAAEAARSPPYWSVHLSGRVTRNHAARASITPSTGPPGFVKCNSRCPRVFLGLSPSPPDRGVRCWPAERPCPRAPVKPWAARIVPFPRLRQNSDLDCCSAVPRKDGSRSPARYQRTCRFAPDQHH
jgi:hypothetical protein